MIITDVKSTETGFKITVEIPTVKDGRVMLGPTIYCTIDEAKKAIAECNLCIDLEAKTAELRPKGNRKHFTNSPMILCKGCDFSSRIHKIVEGRERCRRCGNDLGFTFNRKYTDEEKWVDSLGDLR